MEKFFFRLQLWVPSVGNLQHRGKVAICIKSTFRLLDFKMKYKMLQEKEFCLYISKQIMNIADVAILF